MNTVLSTKSAAGTLRRVEEVTAPHVEDGLTSRLAELRLWIAADLVDVDAALASLEPSDTPMHGAARHLLDLGGKRLRPLCVALAARAGSGFDRAARDLAVAAELVHSATLLHDDVVDLGDRRRGAPTARVIYGNIASIYAGDWLLVEALRRIRSTGHLDLLDRALDTLDQLLGAEALQLALRGTVPARSSYFEVVEGKTASLFRWAMAAGARAGHLDAPAAEAMERYGRLVGVAFQVMDDVLDVAGDASVVGKSLFGDLREGKITYPLLLAVERDAVFGQWLRGVVADASVHVDEAIASRVGAALRDTGAVADARALARSLSEEALGCLEVVPPGRARDALSDVAAALVDRRK
ncbi:MAG: polyprenyl synthetase family protein [Deltaproteobacteria bacterium]|nr:polyprenyl synthetase family protein [Deltaproteobacteria bacterium]